VKSKSGKAEMKSGGRVKANNARCIYCRKCYNSGLCLMHWPEFPAAGIKDIVNRGHDDPVEN
jgi:hypothetical protein